MKLFDYNNVIFKNVVIFATCSINGMNTLDLMRTTVEEAGAIIVAEARFKGFFRPKLKKAAQFGHSLLD